MKFIVEIDLNGVLSHSMGGVVLGALNKISNVIIEDNVYPGQIITITRGDRGIIVVGTAKAIEETEEKA